MFDRPPPDEDALVARFVRGRAEADFRRLFRRFDPSLRRVAARLMGGRSAAVDDVVQESWLRAMRALSAFEARSSFRTWLTGFVINVSRETLRAARREESKTPEQANAAPCGPEAALMLGQALDALPPRARLVLVLHDIAGFTHTEIAELLAIDEGTSKSQLSRARRTARARLSDGDSL